MTLKQQLKAGKLYAQTWRYNNNENIAKASLSRFFSLCKNPYLALSWGKQSICIAHMISGIRPQTPMIFLRSWESFFLHDFERVQVDYLSRFPAHYIEHYKDNVSWNNWDWKETRDYGSEDLQNMAKEVVPDWDGVIMGLSKDESFARRMTLSKKNTKWATIFRYTDDKLRCTPIQFWANEDLAAYIAKYDLPLLSAYHQNGIQARTTARITRNNAEMNGLTDLKKRDINAYNIITKRFPELRRY